MEDQILRDAEINKIEFELDYLRSEKIMEVNQLKKNDLTKQIDALVSRLENEYGLVYNDNKNISS